MMPGTPLSFSAFLYLASAGVAMFIGTYVLARNPGERINRLFFLYCITSAAVAFFEFQLCSSGSLPEASMWIRHTAFWPLIPAFLLHFILVYTRKTPEHAPVWLLVLLYLPPLSYALFRFYLLQGRMGPVLYSWGWSYDISRSTPLTAFIGAWAGMVSVLCLWFSGRHFYSTKNPEVRRQALFVHAGVGLPTFAALFMHWILIPLGFRPPNLSMYGFGAGALFLGLAVFRYRLMTITPESVAEDILATMSEALFLTDQGGRIIRVNYAAVRMLGMEPGELNGRPFQELICAPERDKAKALSMDETVFKDREGNRVAVLLARSGIRDRTGRPLGWLYIARDITERLRMEEYLRQAQKMEAIGQLAGGVAHDFNNQLAGIMGYADVLKKNAREHPQCQRYADKIITCVERAADLTRQLLAFARRGKYLSIPVNLHNIIHEVISLLSHTVDRRIVIRNRLTADMPFVVGDPSQIQNAVLNLGLNARDAMPEGGTLTFSTEKIALEGEALHKSFPDLLPGNYLLVTVADTGTGMDEAVQARVFEPFYTTKETGKGTGIGLAGVYGMVKNHKGAIRLESRKGKGTSFHLYLPAFVGEPVLEAGSGGAAPSGGARPSRRVLLVEDEDIVADTAEEMLVSLGHRVVRARNGREAEELFRGQSADTDLVILDMIMPEWNGLTTLRALQKIRPDVAVLIASGYSLDGDVRTAVEEGAKGLLQKPFSLDELDARIREIFPL